MFSIFQTDFCTLINLTLFLYNMHFKTRFKRVMLKQRSRLSLRKSYTLLSYQTTSSFNNTTFVWRSSIRCALRPFFMAKAFPLLNLIMTSTGWGAINTNLKVFCMTRTRTKDLPIQSWVCYYWVTELLKSISISTLFFSN